MKKIWAIGGGKGGVGKSFICANIATMLAMLDHKTLTIDLDLGGANLHTCLGVGVPQHTLSDFLTQDIPFSKLRAKTNYPQLSLISGAQDEVSMADIHGHHLDKIITGIKEQDDEFTLIDLGAGTTYYTVDLFIQADAGIISILPEPTSIENGYRFIKSALYRKLLSHKRLEGIAPLIQKQFSGKIKSDRKTPEDFLKSIYEIDHLMGQVAEEALGEIQIKLIMNQVRNQREVNLGTAIKNIVRKYFGVSIEYTGFIPYDEQVSRSLKKRSVLASDFPNSNTLVSLENIVAKLLKSSSQGKII